MAQRVYCTKKDDNFPAVSEIQVVAVRDEPNNFACKNCVLSRYHANAKNTTRHAACHLAPRNCSSDRLPWIHFEHA